MTSEKGQMEYQKILIDAYREARYLKWNATFMVKFRSMLPHEAMNQLQSYYDQLQMVHLPELMEHRQLLSSYITTRQVDTALISQLHNVAGSDPSLWEMRDSFEVNHPFLHARVAT